MSEKMIVACPECQTRFVAPLEKFLPSGRKVRCAKCGHAWFQRVDDSQSAVKQSSAETSTSKPSNSDSIIDRAAQAQSASVIERAEKDRANVSSSSEATATSGFDTAATAASTSVAVSADDGYGSEDRAIDQVSPQPQLQKRSFWPRAILYSLCAAIIAGAIGYFFKDPLSEKIPSLAPTLTSWHETVDGVVNTVAPSKKTLKIEGTKYDFEEIEGGKALLVSAEVVNEGQAEQNAPKLVVKVLDAEKKVLHESILAPEDLRDTIKPHDRALYRMRLPLPPEGLESVEVDFASE